ncbi:MAG TPA: ABC transporter substrate-binding protein [Mycobacteriales bacterium]|nr:ABC transporter substrate-binding protein [Mycobacteriales bacterium]
MLALGAADVEIAHALGANLVGAAANPYAADKQWPGVQPALPKSVTLVSWTQPNLEQIAALRPDLILITTAQPGFANAYSQLAEIAPTISYLKGIAEDSGVDLTRLIGKALGRSAEAERMITASGVKTSAFERAHPDLAGKSVAFGQYVGGKLYLVVAPQAPSVTFFESIGMALPAAVAKLPVQAPPGVSVISAENYDILDQADFVILGVASPKDGEALLANPLVSKLRIAQAGHIDFVDFNQANAFLAPNPALTDTMVALITNILH